MSYIEDLSQCQYFPLESTDKLLAVGWLDDQYSYHQDAVEESFIVKLTELLLHPWQPIGVMGSHKCQFCRFSGGPSTFEFNKLSIRMGINNLFVPYCGFIYVAPSLILHYIDAHGYAPPEQFQRAVMACPPMKSMQYLKKILENGGRSIVKGMKLEG
jgi:hypothetical protein